MLGAGMDSRPWRMKLPAGGSAWVWAQVPGCPGGARVGGSRRRIEPLHWYPRAFGACIVHWPLPARYCWYCCLQTCTGLSWTRPMWWQPSRSCWESWPQRCPPRGPAGTGRRRSRARRGRAASPATSGQPPVGGAAVQAGAAPVVGLAIWLACLSSREQRVPEAQTHPPTPLYCPSPSCTAAAWTRCATRCAAPAGPRWPLTWQTPPGLAPCWRRASTPPSQPSGWPRVSAVPCMGWECVPATCRSVQLLWPSAGQLRRRRMHAGAHSACVPACMHPATSAQPLTAPAVHPLPLPIP